MVLDQVVTLPMQAERATTFGAFTNECPVTSVAQHHPAEGEGFMLFGGRAFSYSLRKLKRLSVMEHVRPVKV